VFRKETPLFDVDTLVADCRLALTESQPLLAVKEILERAIAKPDKVATALEAQPGVEVLHRSPELTIVSVVVPAGLPATLPHDHRMWAVVGIYGGQEDNQFFRRVAPGLTETGGRSIRTSETLAMGDDTIHSICNPLDHEALAAIHVYGGDLVGAERSMWTKPDFEEQPYDDTKVVGRGGIRGAR
jgi:predicted metal-dependent enzyme (double-stranded beta helix superfamily)